MADKAHPTSISSKSKKSPAMLAKLRALGIPKAIAETFPLTPHDTTRRWCKKLPTPHGPKVFYFGPLADWQAALTRFNDEKEALVAGRTPSARKDGMRLIDLCNRFLHFKRALVSTGELTMRSWSDYHQCCERLMKVLGANKSAEDMQQQDFERLRLDFGKTWGPVRIGGEINRTRILFRYAFESGLIEKPVRFGPSFKRPSRKELRKVRAKTRQAHGARMFTPEELRVILDAAKQPMKTMILLGINGGMNNSDVATITTDTIDLERGLAHFPRPKTGVPRTIPLWPETLASIKEYLAIRPKPKDAADGILLFLTGHRRPWYRHGRFVEEDGATVIKGIDNPVSRSFRELLVSLGINGGRNFLALRHTFRTVGRGARDREAIDALMGHVDGSMAGHYIEDGLPDDRLRAVTQFVRTWLFTVETPKLKIADEVA
jgi:integrase